MWKSPSCTLSGQMEKEFGRLVSYQMRDKTQAKVGKTVNQGVKRGQSKYELPGKWNTEGGWELVQICLHLWIFDLLKVSGNVLLCYLQVLPSMICIDMCVRI